MPLISSFWLSNKRGKHVWIEPEVDAKARTVRYRIASGQGEPPPPPKTGRGTNFRCLVCSHQVADQHIKDEGLAGRMGAQPLAAVLDGKSGRAYCAAEECPPPPAPPPGLAPELQAQLNYDPRAIWFVGYGLTTYADLFTPRQLVALTTFSPK